MNEIRKEKKSPAASLSLKSINHISVNLFFKFLFLYKQLGSWNIWINAYFTLNSNSVRNLNARIYILKPPFSQIWAFVSSLLSSLSLIVYVKGQEEKLWKWQEFWNGMWKFGIFVLFGTLGFFFLSIYSLVMVFCLGRCWQDFIMTLNLLMWIQVKMSLFFLLKERFWGLSLVKFLHQWRSLAFHVPHSTFWLLSTSDWISRWFLLLCFRPFCMRLFIGKIC